ncbi:MAG: DUF5685 family protein [Lachnospiraceae bacterium]|nr:DUF5685 family protein [Lachnospiraceae bacterium]
MFGYIVANQEELKLKDIKRYRSFYCGLCRVLKKKFGMKGQLTLSYDMTFLVMLLTALYEVPAQFEKRHCVMHPVEKHEMRFNEISEYAADMEILLAYYKGRDDWMDEKSLKGRALEKALTKQARLVHEKWPRQSAAIADYIRRLDKAEKSGESDLDKVAGYTGMMMGELFCYREDEWASEMKRMGFFMGKFIYLMDAYEDLEKDRKKHNYNPWESYSDRPDFDALVENTLTMMLADAARAFEILPIVQDVDILRNILYSGVWTRYGMIKQKREQKGGQHDR